MTFKVGDKVKYKSLPDFPEWAGYEGVVVSSSPTSSLVQTTKPTRYAGHGTRVSLSTENLELIKEEPATFQPGGRVVYKEDYMSANAGDTGTVVRSERWNGGHTWVKLDKNGEEQGGYTTRLERIEEPAFSFKDIQVGDKIRRTETWDTGTVLMLEGTVAQKSSNVATTKEGLTVGYWDFGNRHITVELLDRPKKLELWENRKPGDKIASYHKDGTLDRIFTKRSDDGWDTLVVNHSGKIQNGFDRSDTEMANYCSRYAEKYDFQLV